MTAVTATDHHPAAGPELVDRARGLYDVLAANADAADRNRRLPEESVQALRDADLLRLTVPARFGGHEASTETLISVCAALAQACSSAAWVTMIMNGTQWATCLFGEAVQDEVFGNDPNAGVCGVLMPTAEGRRVEGGVIASGRWSFASGCYHATWGTFTVPVAGDGGEAEPMMALMPMSDLTIEDTWFVAGMRGTGSNTVVADEVFVPDHHLMTLPRVMTGGRSPDSRHGVYRAMAPSYLTLILAGPTLGMGRAALAEVLAKAPRRGISNSPFTRQMDSATFQTQVADGALTLDTAELHVLRAARDIDAAAAEGRDLDMWARGRVKGDAGYAVAKVREGIELLLTAHGTASMADGSRLQRIWRDANTGSRHAVLNLGLSREVWGRVLLGLEPEITDMV